MAVYAVTEKYLRVLDGKIPMKYFLECSKRFFIKLAKIMSFQKAFRIEVVSLNSACEIMVTTKIIHDLIIFLEDFKWRGKRTRE